MTTRRRPMHLDSTIIEEPFMQSIPFKNNLTIMVPSRYIYFFATSLSWTWPLLHNMVYMFNVSFSRAMRSPCTRGTNLYVCSNMLAQTVGSTILVPSHTLRILSSWGSSSNNIKKGTPPSLAYLCKPFDDLPLPLASHSPSRVGFCVWRILDAYGGLQRGVSRSVV